MGDLMTFKSAIEESAKRKQEENQISSLQSPPAKGTGVTNGEDIEDIN